MSGASDDVSPVPRRAERCPAAQAARPGGALPGRSGPGLSQTGLSLATRPQVGSAFCPRSCWGCSVPARPQLLSPSPLLSWHPRGDRRPRTPGGPAADSRRVMHGPGTSGTPTLSWQPRGPGPCRSRGQPGPARPGGAEGAPRCTSFSEATPSGAPALRRASLRPSWPAVQVEPEAFPLAAPRLGPPTAQTWGLLPAGSPAPAPASLPPARSPVCPRGKAREGGRGGHLRNAPWVLVPSTPRGLATVQTPLSPAPRPRDPTGQDGRPAVSMPDVSSFITDCVRLRAVH